MIHSPDRTALIEAVVRERLPTVEDVRVKPDVDHEGDPVLRIRVVLDPDLPMDGRMTLDRPTPRGRL